MSQASDTETATVITLFEVLLFLGIVGVLVLIVWAVFSSKDDVQYVRNAKRESDIQMLHHAFLRYALDHNGQFQPVDLSTDCSIDENVRFLCSASLSEASCRNYGCIYAEHLVEGGYIDALPADPFDAHETEQEQAIIEYSVALERNQLTVYAPRAEEVDMQFNGENEDLKNAEL